MRRRTRPALAAVLGMVGVIGTYLVPSAATAQPLTQVFTRNVLPGLAAAVDRGAAPGNTPLRLTISLGRPDPAGEQAMLDAVHDPASPQFGRFLSVDAFADRFGVRPDRLDAVTSWLRSGGLRVDSVSAARDVVNVDGDAAAVSALFHTPMHAFDSPDGPFVANTVAPAVPANIGVTNVVGLNTVQRMRTPQRVRHAQSGCAGPTCVGGTTPGDLWSVYQQPPAVTGAGQQVAIFGDGQTSGVIDDLRAYEQRYHLPPVPVTVKHPAGDTDFSDDTGHVEWNIDTQASHGMAPGLSGMSLYFGENLSDADVAKVFSTFTDDRHGPMQASASYGECESIPVVSPIAGSQLLNPYPPPPVSQGLGNNLDATLDAVTRQAALEGKTIFSSTGDTGSSCPVVAAPVIGAGNGVLNQGVPVTNSPASLPYVVGVGGTVLYTDGAGHRAREYGWPFSGGGSTLFTPAPSYQQGTQGLSLPCVTAPTQVCRGIADVSAQSGDVTGNGYNIVSQGKFLDGGGGGTSLSSPLWAGMWARVQSAAQQPGGFGFASYPLYRLGKDPKTEPRDFFDVSSTDTSTGLPSGNGLYLTQPGWDYVTGFGTPRVNGLICDLAHRC